MKICECPAPHVHTVPHPVAIEGLPTPPPANLCAACGQYWSPGHGSAPLPGNSFAKPRAILYMPGLVQSLARASFITDAVTAAVDEYNRFSLDKEAGPG